MNALNLFTKAYACLHNYPGVPYWILTPMRRIVRYGANQCLPKYLEKVHRQHQVNGEGIIVSFTSFPGRIQHVWKVVESLKNQSIRPEKIILWLSKEQFASADDIPQSLKECEDSLFDIRMVAGDIRSHKKYYYAMQEFTDKTIVTCDDDIYYHPNTLLKLVQASKRYPGCITANVTKQIAYNKNGELLPYLQWNKKFEAYSSRNRVQIGVGGVLYPPHSLYHLVLREDLFMRLAPLADDLWLNLMARLNRTPVVQTGLHLNCLPIKNEGPALSAVNNGTENMNDQQIAQMREWLHAEGMEDVFGAHYQVENQTGG